jgi:hypothetical protein
VDESESIKSAVVGSVPLQDFPEHLFGAIRTWSKFQWPHGLRHELSLPAQNVGSWVRIPLKAWMSVCVHHVFVMFVGRSPVQGVLPTV